jgi:signal transduction histidine kinase
MFRLITILILVSASLLSKAQLFITDQSPLLINGFFVSYLEDPHGSLSFEDVLQKDADFVVSQEQVINLLYTKSSYWLKIDLENKTQTSRLALEIANSQIDSAILYYQNHQSIVMRDLGDRKPYKARFVDHQHFIWPIELEPGASQVYYIRVNSREQMSLPLIIGQERLLLSLNYKLDLLAGVYFGIMLVMFFYNLFLFISIRDRSYLFYIIYIAAIALAQATLLGYAFKYFWPSLPYFNHLAVLLFSALSGIGAIQFARTFLLLETQLPVLNRWLNIFIVFYLLAFAIFVLGYEQEAYKILDATALILSLYALTFSIILSWRGQRTAKFFLLGWSFFMLGLFVFVARNYGWLPYNFVTKNALLIGSGMEALLLSVALADRINILKKDKEISQAKALRISKENENLVKEQNLKLESKVIERTAALQEANDGLAQAIKELKEAQTQLVNAEKMASLGQLTAGIAHEINNPINFVTSNIIPLRRDLEDLMSILAAYESIEHHPEQFQEIFNQVKQLKKELDFEYLKEELITLIAGMEDGAKRTAEIVKGLRIFSRLDESDLKKVNINEGIESTLILLNSSMGGKIDLEKDFEPDTYVECYAGKLNQVIMNIANNAIQAMHEMNNGRRGKLRISTRTLNEEVVIEIRDNGNGIPDNIKEKIFEPFFTTKPVGQGTGLGLSIVYSIIEKHKGRIEVSSTEGEGTTFTITLPKLQE